MILKWAGKYSETNLTKVSDVNITQKHFSVCVLRFNSSKAVFIMKYSWRKTDNSAAFWKSYFP